MKRAFRWMRQVCLYICIVASLCYRRVTSLLFSGGEAARSLILGDSLRAFAEISLSLVVAVRD